MTAIRSFCGGSDPDWDQEPFCASTQPPCEHQDAMHCEPCCELTEIEARIEDLHSQLKNLHEQHRQARTRRNHVHSSIIRLLPFEILTYIFTLAFPTRVKPPCCPSLATEWTVPLVIAAVCQPWRVLALSIPNLWSALDVDAKKPNFPLLTHQIAYAGNSPLSIYLFAQPVAVRARHLQRAKQAMSFVLKQLHRTSSFYVSLEKDSILIGVFCDLPDIDYPKAAPLLEEIHIHWFPTTNSEQFRFAIEPPSPRRVVSESDHTILLDWSNVSSVTLKTFHLPPPFLAPSMDLRHLDLDDWSSEPEDDELPVISQSIEELIIRSHHSLCFILASTSLPSLRALEIHFDSALLPGLGRMAPLCCAFWRRSLCPPLKILTLEIKNFTTLDITALPAILETTNLLQRLTLQLTSPRLSEPSPSVEPLLLRFTSSRFLPCLQSLGLEIESLPPFRILLDLMLDCPPCENIDIGFGSIRRPLDVLKLNFHIQDPTLHPIPEDDLFRISQLRAAGKAITITSLFKSADGTLEVVEY